MHAPGRCDRIVIDYPSWKKNREFVARGLPLGEYILREIWNKADSRTTIKEAGSDRNLLNSILDCCNMFFLLCKSTGITVHNYVLFVLGSGAFTKNRSR